MWHKFRSFSLRAQIGIWVALGIVVLASAGALASPATKPASSNSPLATVAPATFAVVAISPSPTAAPTPEPTAVPTPEPTAVPTPVPTAVPQATAAPTVKPVAKTPKPTAAPTQVPVATDAPAASSACHPLSNAGNCYKPGQFCRDSDHMVSGIGAGGEAIQCLNNNGWRWEPA